ncbi:MAG: hypothetical protein JW940_21615 [Polyangiaceae bacterium]|nr:hypothetical protein [Polyangiaceae bacterium]
MAATDAKPDPIKGVAHRITFPLFDSAGALKSGATGLDSEVSLDGGAFADCTNGATEITTSSGMYYLDLTAAEMDADTVAVIVKATDALTTPIVLYPRTTPLVHALEVGTATAGSASTITLAATAPAVADIYNWCVISLIAGTGAGQSRLIQDYSSGRVVTVADNWVTNPSTDTVYCISGLGIQPISAAAAANLERAAATMVYETVQASPAPTVTTFAGSSALDATADHYNGRIVIFLDGALANQGAKIEDYSGSTDYQFTVTAMTEAATAGDHFLII